MLLLLLLLGCYLAVEERSHHITHLTSSH